ncbi:MAG: hypothetical protein IKD33_01910, partial [Bacteroidales bacterium]|nr:hypothetical protein [Bacteroidales bacterium]
TLKKPARLIVYHGSNIKLDTTFSSNIGSAVFNTSFLVGEDDLVKVKLLDNSLSNQTTFGNIVCKPHYTFIPLNSSSIIKDTVEYDIPACYNVKTNIDSIYTKLFGPLYRGWGQFTYNHSNHDTLINIAHLALSCLSSSDIDTSGFNNIDTSAMSFDNFNTLVDEAGLGSVSTNAKYYAMEPNSKHWLWYGPSNATLVTSNGMSNTIRTDIFSTMEEIEVDRDCPAPADPNVRVHSKTSKSSNFNRNYSASFDIIRNIGYSRSTGHSKIIADFMDMNGDRYPDPIGEGAIQYTKPSGGLGTKICEYAASTSDATSSGGLEKGGSIVNAAYLHNRKGQMSNRSEAIGHILDNTSQSGTTGIGESEEILIDVNGDGLPDKVYKNGYVALNWGYLFVPATTCWFNGFNRESSFITGGLGYNDNFFSTQFNVCQFSVGGGFGANYSRNKTRKMLIDINGDGLPDKVTENGDTIYVHYNIGYGVWSTDMSMGISDIIKSHSLSGSINIAGTAGVPLFGTKATVTLSGSAFNPSCNIDKVQIADFNNDGLPDFVTSDTKGTIRVHYNQLGGVNLLTKVTNPMGGTIDINYNLTESSIKNPNRMWVMDSVTVDAKNTPVGDSLMKTSFEYSNPYYDRYERTSYGFEKVTTRQYKGDNTVYRYTEECYNNSTYALKGKKKSEALFDGSGKKYTETLYDMAIFNPENKNDYVDSCSEWVAPVITSEIHNFYEGQTTVQLTTMISYEYDNYRNIIYYRNWGDTIGTITTDDVIVDITYYTNRPKNMVGLKSGFTVSKAGSGSTLMRKYDFNYDTSGNLTRERIYKNSTSVEAVYNMTYDNYGNVLTFTKPADENGNRPQYTYVYDTYTHTYPTSITDAFNLTATATYDYRFGVPLKKTDPSGDSVVYTYDYRGRTKTITGPKELAANKPYTIRMEYYPTNGIGQGKYFHGWNTPFAHTFHY